MEFLIYHLTLLSCVCFEGDDGVCRGDDDDEDGGYDDDDDNNDVNNEYGLKFSNNI